MGLLQSKYVWYVYSRDAESNGWNREPLLTSEIPPIGKFKHMVWSFALQTTPEYKTYKSIYLYNGSTRIMKAELLKPTEDEYYKLIMEFPDTETATMWDTVDEMILNTNNLWKETEFNNHYVTLESDKPWIRRWQLVKPTQNTKPGIPRLSLTQYITSFTSP